MSNPPAEPQIYHIAHIDRLESIIRDGRLWCDAEIIKRRPPGTTIGMGSIKERRLRLPVACHAGDCVGDYVPFYFCPRSIMLYVLHKGNHPELSYRDGQRPIIHLQASLTEAVEWAEEKRRRWAFSLSNAGARYAEFRDDLGDLDQINWNAVRATDFRDPDVNEGKQAEFLVHHSFPWHLVRRIGVLTPGMRQQVSDILSGLSEKPKLELRSEWYF